jgi:DNA-directed RNA polymerase subunit omega
MMIDSLIRPSVGWRSNMARISVEDCLRNVESPFSLVHAAVRRARQLQMGSKPLMQKKGDKNTVIALREIAQGLVEQVPLSELEPEVQPQELAAQDEEFSQLFDSPDLNVRLDTDEEELEDKKGKKKADEEDEDDLEEWDEEEGEEEEE